jgi:hypothetical protein
MNETVLDPRTYPVATDDGAMSPAQRAALPTRSVPQREPAATPDRRLDNRSELQVLKSTVEGLQEKVARLGLAVQTLLQERYEARQVSG